METSDVLRQFSRLGARAQVLPLPAGEVRIDVRADRRGEYFELRLNESRLTDLRVIALSPRERHLVLQAESIQKGKPRKLNFLCGHDERAWFVAAVPGPVTGVRQAMEALKPLAVREAQARAAVPARLRNRRRNPVFVRQGEWFFVLAPRLAVDQRLVLADEPLRRGRGKPHRCEELYRERGEPVYVCPQYPMGLTERQHARLLARSPEARHLPWQIMRRNAAVYVRGRVRHPDHKTIRLAGWHRVLMNTEGQAPGAQNVVFLD